MSLKKPVTPSGIDPGTVRLVAQRLNDYATPGPTSTEAVRETGELVRETHHVDPYTERNIRSNDVIIRFFSEELRKTTSII